MDEWMDEWRYGLLNVGQNIQIQGWIGGWMNRQIDEWIDKYMEWWVRCLDGLLMN